MIFKGNRQWQIIFILFVIVVFSGTMAESAKAAISIPPVGLVIDGVSLTLDVPPQIIKGRMLVPLRGLFETLGATVAWEPKAQTITIVFGDKTIILQAGKLNVTVNNAVQILDVSPMIVNGRVLVPLRFLSENLAANVEWISSTRTVKIISKKIVQAVLVQPITAVVEQDIGSDMIPSRSGPDSVSDESTSGSGDSPSIGDGDTGGGQPEFGSAIIEIFSTRQTISVGETFDVMIDLKNGIAIYTLESKLQFNSDLIKATSVKGSFLGGIDLIKKIDNTAGTVSHVATLLGQVPGKSGDGNLTIVTFQALKAGEVEIRYYDTGVQLVNATGEYISYNSSNNGISLIISPE